MLPPCVGATVEYSLHRVSVRVWKAHCKNITQQLMEVLADQAYPDRAQKLDTLMEVRLVLVRHRPRTISYLTAKEMLRVYRQFIFFVTSDLIPIFFYSPPHQTFLSLSPHDISYKHTHIYIIYLFIFMHIYIHILYPYLNSSLSIATI
jgi:hypothetical protein